jgi:hypothetical protein
MSDHPYSRAPGYRRWSQAVARISPSEVDPLTSVPFQITRSDRIVSAGSCFAQHIGRRLVQSGYNYLLTETAHPLLARDVAETLGYGIYSARYGNVYTARQLLQLQRRAYGHYRPTEDIWEDNGRYRDPYRPAIQPEGFATRSEFELDRTQHLAAVRRAFESMDVFIFTLGLTECWRSMEDGAVFPVCPGTLGGRFDPTRHVFMNLTTSEVVADLQAFIGAVRAINATVKVVLTVSPVPLVATAEDRHILLSNVYSKSVLRVAAEELSKQLPAVAYFPAYEIVTGTFNRGRYFAEDQRSVTDEGVDHVMRVFFRHMTTEGQVSGDTPAAPECDTFLERSQQAIAALCEEERLDTIE